MSPMVIRVTIKDSLVNKTTKALKQLQVDLNNVLTKDKSRNIGLCVECNCFSIQECTCGLDDQAFEYGIFVIKHFAKLFVVI